MSNEERYQEGVIRRALIFMGFSELAIKQYFDRSTHRDDCMLVEDAVFMGFDLERAVQINDAKMYAVTFGIYDSIGEIQTNSIIEKDEDDGQTK